MTGAEGSGGGESLERALTNHAWTPHACAKTAADTRSEVSLHMTMNHRVTLPVQSEPICTGSSYKTGCSQLCPVLQGTLEKQSSRFIYFLAKATIMGLPVTMQQVGR